MRKLSIYLASLICVFAGFRSSAHAQGKTPDLRPGNFELGLYGGASYGVDAFHGMGGVNLSYSLPKLLLPYVEFSYFPGIPRQEDNADHTDTFHGSDRLIDFHGGVHIRLAPSESRIVPYGVVGFGVLQSRITGYTHHNQPLPGQPVDETQPTTTGTDPAVNFGGGVRVYQTSAFGYRAEVKVYRPLSGRFTGVVPKFEGGIFFQFGGR